MGDEQKRIMQAVYFLSDKLKYPIMAINNELTKSIKEIRVRRGCPIMVGNGKNYMFLRYDGSLTNSHNSSGLCTVSDNDMDDSIRKLCDYTIHAFQNEMKNGYITINGGHRVGICATAILNQNSEITAVRNVSSINIRISREINGAADELINKVFYDRKLKSILLAGEPASGKTTVLRDLARNIGGSEFSYKRVCVVDERSELAATFEGKSQNDVGVSTDVLDGYKKSDGMLIALRAMSPDVIICDEIGSDEDVRAIESVSNAGVNLIASIHSESFSQLVKRPQFQNLMKAGVFETAAVLCGKEHPCEIDEVISLKKYWR